MSAISMTPSEAGVLSPRYARYALGVLFAINLFNYVDRQVVFGVFPLVQEDLRLSDASLGALASAFMILYMLTAVPLGVLGDRLPRSRLIAVGVAVWGGATFLSGFARSYGPLFLARTVVGIGEASYGPTATAMISDFFSKRRRGLVNALFNAAIPVGGAVGVTVGGLVGSWLGWRAAFLLVGGPSLVLAALAWRLRDPPRGGQDRAATERTSGAAGPPPRPSLGAGILGLFRTPTFVMVCAVGMLIAFATGAFTAWLPTYLHRVKGFSLREAAIIYGLISAAGGFLGVVAGGVIGDALTRRFPAGHLLTIAGGFILSAPFAFLFLLHHHARVFLPALFFAVFFLLLYVGSVNAVIHNVVDPSLRATALAIFVFLIHLGGDALSPVVVGLISDRRRSLQAAMLLLPVLIFFAGVIALAATSVVGGDLRRIEGGLAAAGSGSPLRG